MKTQYKAIFKLKRMLEDAGIPFEFVDHSVKDPRLFKFHENGTFEHYQICYPESGEARWISVIEGFATYGGQQDKLEIMGGLTPYEEWEYSGNVIGYLTVDNVFKRIKNHYEGKYLK